MGSVFTRLMGYVSLGCNFMGYTFGYFGILRCDFGQKMLDGVYIWPKMVVHWGMILDAFIGYVLTNFLAWKIWWGMFSKFDGSWVPKVRSHIAVSYRSSAPPSHPPSLSLLLLLSLTLLTPTHTYKNHMQFSTFQAPSLCPSVFIPKTSPVLWNPRTAPGRKPPPPLHYHDPLVLVLQLLSPPPSPT